MNRIVLTTLSIFAFSQALADVDSTYGGTFRAPGVAAGDGTNVTIELVSDSALIYCVEFPDQAEPNCFGNGHVPIEGSPDGEFTFSAPDFGTWEFERISADQIDVTFTHVSGRVSFAELSRGVVYSDIPN